MIGHYKMSLTGTSHLAHHKKCQDACNVLTLKNGWVAAAIADGIGSAPKSDKGASSAVETVLRFIEENHPEKWHEKSLQALLMVAYHKAMTTISRLAQKNGDELSDYDTTLTVLLYNGTDAVYGHAGDGGIMALSPYGEFSVLTTAQKGEAFNETFPLRAGPDHWEFGRTSEDVCALLMMTDGVFDIAKPWPLAQTEQPVYVRYVRPFMDRNLLPVSGEADFERAQAEIRAFLCGEESQMITDDKTVVGIINTDVMPEIRPEAYYREPDWEAMKKEHDERLYHGEDVQPKPESEAEQPEEIPERGEEKPFFHDIADASPVEQSTLLGKTKEFFHRFLKGQNRM